jgi:hypothetical protein
MQVDVKDISEDVTRSCQGLHAPQIAPHELLAVSNFGQDFDGEVNVAQAVNVLSQHAPEEDHAVDPAKEPRIPVYPLNTHQKLTKCFVRSPSRNRFSPSS